MEQTVQINSEFITLGQLLKELGVIPTGGAAKWYLQDFPVMINDEEETRRGKKLFPGDKVDINDFGVVTIEKDV
ncbi:S4 domain-containing protein YaaA [Bacillus shivajii]|uniref:S4 domain-containing protein YaaA n=1 Tax=Bacillus shivajii TaxID=1983719 RepID=UPI001CF9B6F1|nr:S4 domain-containing protein YaaA [Bacillus shivajii]UCZ53256.1 S4 domain-containing protein YaaA [Bacillus shivajii]